jgi:hypothetical protein
MYVWSVELLIFIIDFLMFHYQGVDCKSIGDPNVIDHWGLVWGRLCPESSLGRCADNVIIPLDLKQLFCPGFSLAAGPPSCFTTDIVDYWRGALWRACNLTAFTSCLTGPVDYPFASRLEVQSTGGVLMWNRDTPISVVCYNTMYKGEMSVKYVLINEKQNQNIAWTTGLIRFDSTVLNVSGHIGRIILRIGIPGLLKVEIGPPILGVCLGWGLRSILPCSAALLATCWGASTALHSFICTVSTPQWLPSCTCFWLRLMTRLFIKIKIKEHFCWYDF